MTLDDLQVVGWKDSELTGLSQVAAREIRLEGGAFTTLRGQNTTRLRHLTVQRRMALKEAGVVAGRTLTDEACNARDLDSLARARGLTSLARTSQKWIDSQELVRDCRQLAHLHLGSVPPQGTGFRTPREFVVNG